MALEPQQSREDSGGSFSMCVVFARTPGDFLQQNRKREIVRAKIKTAEVDDANTLRVIKRSISCSSMQHLFDQKYSKNSNIVKYY